MTEDPTKELVDHASRGDGNAIEDLTVRYLDDVRAYLAHHAGQLVRAKESISDLAQSVCREVLERIREERVQYQGEAAFKAWLLQAALHKLQNRHRYYAAGRREAAREANLSDGDQAADAFLRTLRSPSGEAILREELDRGRQAFAALPDPYREIIILIKVHQLSHRDAASKLGITEAHSRVLLSRALARLATVLQVEGE
jgi:RNA polymerase sigma factor (sigma-70 family)